MNTLCYLDYTEVRSKQIGFLYEKYEKKIPILPKYHLSKYLIYLHFAEKIFGKYWLFLNKGLWVMNTLMQE